jgi:hypothetical protein
MSELVKQWSELQGVAVAGHRGGSGAHYQVSELQVRHVMDGVVTIGKTTRSAVMYSVP